MTIVQGDKVTLTDGATVATDVSLGDYFYLSGFRATRTMSAPTNAGSGMLITYLIENTGGVSATSWDTVFALAGAWTDPSPDRARAITFFYDGTVWVETTRTGWDLKRVAFDPADVASLAGWWEAEDLALADAASVSTWPARYGIDLVAVSGNEPTFKTAIQNSRPIVRFDGTNDWLSVSNPLYGRQSCSVFAVFAKGDTAGGLRCLADFAGSGVNGLIIYEGHTAANGSDWQFGTGAASDINTVTTAGTAFHQWSWTVPTGGTPNLYKDAGSAITPTGGLTAGYAALTQVTLYVGSQGGTQRYMKGDLAELLVYSTALGGTDRANVATYLKNKWGTP